MRPFVVAIVPEELDLSFIYKRSQELNRAIGRAIIYNYDLKVFIRLVEDRLKSFEDEILPVIGWDNY